MQEFLIGRRFAHLLAGTAIALGSATCLAIEPIEPQHAYGLPTRSAATIERANPRSDDVSVIDTIPIGGGPASVAVSPDGELVYTATGGSETFGVIDATTNSVIQTVAVSRVQRCPMAPTGEVLVQPSYDWMVPGEETGAMVIVVPGLHRVGEVANVHTLPAELAFTMPLECVPNAAAQDFTFTPRCGAGAACRELEARVSGLELTGDYRQLLYICRVEVAAEAAGHSQRPVTVSNVSVSSPGGDPLPARTEDVRVDIQEEPVNLQLRVVGSPGERHLALFLRTGQAVARTTNVIDFPREVQITGCTVNTEINKDLCLGFLPEGCEVGVDCEALEAVVSSFENSDPIPSGPFHSQPAGVELYGCEISIDENAPVPDYYRFGAPEAKASDLDGNALQVSAGDLSVDPQVLGVYGAGRGHAAQLAEAIAAGICASRAGSNCRTDADCVESFCAEAQGVCSGGEDDGLLCGPELDCAGGQCVDTVRLCASGIAKGMACLVDGHCPGSACSLPERRCEGGDFDHYACIDDTNCPLGCCAVPGEERTATSAPSPTPTLSPTVTPDGEMGVSPLGTGNSSSSGCAVVSAAPSAPQAAWLLLAAFALREILRRGGRKPAPARSQQASDVANQSVSSP